MKYNGFFIVCVISVLFVVGVYAFDKKRKIYESNLTDDAQQVMDVSVRAGSSIQASNYTVMEGEQDLGGDFILTNHLGETFNSEIYRSKNMGIVVFFGFSHCPVMCPKALGSISKAIDLISEEERARLKFVFITLDPERDDVSRLREFHSEFHNEIEMLTGDVQYIKDLMSKYKVFAERMSDDEHYDINHSGIIYLMNTSGKIGSFLGANDSHIVMSDGFRRLLK